MNTEAAPRRPLTSMTREEYQRLYAVAFNDRFDRSVQLAPVGYVEDHNPRRSYVVLRHGVCLSNGYFSLFLFPDGNGYAERTGKPHGFNLRKVLALVDELNLEFGHKESPKRTFADLNSEEGYSIFTAAFGRVPHDDIMLLPWNGKGVMTFSDGHLLLTLSDEGQATAHMPREAYKESIFWPAINLQRLISCLAGLNVNFGSQPNQAGK